MNKNVKKMWVEALQRPDTEKGWYPQGRGWLCRQNVSLDGGEEPHLYGDAFCCLGVLTNLAILSGAECGTRPHNPWGPNDWPTEAVQSWAGLTNADLAALVRMNDTSRHNFEEIARYIKASL